MKTLTSQHLYLLRCVAVARDRLREIGAELPPESGGKVLAVAALLSSGMKARGARREPA